MKDAHNSTPHNLDLLSRTEDRRNKTPTSFGKFNSSYRGFSTENSFDSDDKKPSWDSVYQSRREKFIELKREEKELREQALREAHVSRMGIKPKEKSTDSQAQNLKLIG